MNIANDFKRQAATADQEIRQLVNDVNERFYQVTGKVGRSLLDQMRRLKSNVCNNGLSLCALSPHTAIGKFAEQPDDELDAELLDILEDEATHTQGELMETMDMPDSDTSENQLIEYLLGSGSSMDELQHLDAGGDDDEERDYNPQTIELCVIGGSIDDNMYDEPEMLLDAQEELADDEFDQALTNDYLDYGYAEYLEDVEGDAEAGMVV